MISLSELEPSNTAIIREVYDSDNAQELFEMELERALQVKFFLVVNSQTGVQYNLTIPLFTNQYFIIVQVGCRTIIIEPTKLGDETSRWISIGNLLHKVALMSGFGAFAIGIMFA